MLPNPVRLNPLPRLRQIIQRTARLVPLLLQYSLLLLPAPLKQRLQIIQLRLLKTQIILLTPPVLPLQPLQRRKLGVPLRAISSLDNLTLNPSDLANPSPSTETSCTRPHPSA